MMRLKGRVNLTVCVDKVAASGGYMMACIADKVIASEFSIIGSIGVVADAPNVNRLLKRFNIDYDIYTAGESKRTITMLGENTEKGREKFIEQLEDTHDLFKGHVAKFRPSVDIGVVSDGSYWYGSEALKRGLVDEVSTSSSYIMSLFSEKNVYGVKFKSKKGVGERFGIHSAAAISSVIRKTLKNNF